MRKFYAFFAFIAMMTVAMTAGAWSYDIPTENPVLQGEEYHLELVKDYNFHAGKYNGEDMEVKGNGCFQLYPDAASFKLNGFASYQVAAPECMKNFYIQIGTTALNLRNDGRTGLHNYGSGSRYVAIADVKAGQVIVCQWGLTSTDKGTDFVVQPGTAISGATCCEFTNITDEIHAAQTAAYIAENGEPEEGVATADAFSYWRAESDGFFVVEIQRNTAIQGMQIWADATAAEYVTSPSFTMTKVDRDDRYGTIEAGSSSKGNEVLTYYSFESEDPLFFEDTDEIESADTLWLDDDHVEFELTNIVYKKKVVKDEASGEFGVYLYEEELSFGASDDEDGDGFVNVNICTVSPSSLAFSDVVTVRVAVGEITLNPPTLTLVGINGVERTYQIGWTNNTLCHEPFTFTAVCDGDAHDELGLGATVVATDNISVKVEAPGYIEGEYELAEVLNKGVDMYRKNKAKDEAGEHDWNYVVSDQATKDKFMGKVVEYCYLEDNPNVKYSAEEYENSEAADGTDLSGAIPVYANYGWAWDGNGLRATLSVAGTKDEAGAWLEPLEEGVDKNANGYGYYEDKINWVSRDGLTISCPPNTANNSCILQYIDKADGDGSDGIGSLGLYCMARPTLTFDREVAEYGDFVLVYQGAGGSNYTNNRWPSVHEVPADQLLSFQLNSGGIHLFYIDVYTSDKPEDYEDPYVTEISNVATPKALTGNIYSMDGRIIRRNADTNGLQKGMYILNGKKYLVK